MLNIRFFFNLIKLACYKDKEDCFEDVNSIMVLLDAGNVLVKPEFDKVREFRLKLYQNIIDTLHLRQR